MYVPTVVLMWVGGVVERFAVSSATEVSLWYPWPDGVPALLFITAFVMVYRDILRLEKPIRVGARAVPAFHGYSA
jgi:hypothetical protein